MPIELNTTNSQWETTTGTGTTIQPKQPATLNQSHAELGLREKVKHAAVGFIFGVTMGTPTYGAMLLGGLGSHKLANALHYKCVEELGYQTNAITGAVGSTLTRIGVSAAIVLSLLGSRLVIRKIASSNHVIQTALKTDYGINGSMAGFFAGAISMGLFAQLLRNNSFPIEEAQ